MEKHYTIGFIGQMNYKSHRDKYLGILKCLNANPNVFVRQLDVSGYSKRLRNAILRQQDFDGLIFGNERSFAQFTDFCRATRCPTIVIGNKSTQLPPGAERLVNARVSVDNKAIAEMAADFFLRRGYSNFAYLGYATKSRDGLWGVAANSALREQCFCKAVSDKGHTISVFNTPGELNASDLADLDRWIDALPKPCAIMAFWDPLAKQVAESCCRQHINMPEQIAVLGTDNDDIICENTVTPLSSIKIGLLEAGVVAATQMLRILNGQKPDKETIIYPTGIEERMSTLDLHGSSRLVSLACAYIHQHAAEGIDVKDVASHVHTSVRILQLRFKEVLGKSPKKFILDSQFAAVEKLLLNTTLPISEIALKCGFASHHLTNIFRKHRNQSMSAWRAANRL